MGSFDEEVVFDGGKEAVGLLREAGQALRNKKKKETLPTLCSSHEMSCAIAKDIIRKHHTHLVGANVAFFGTTAHIKGVGAKVSKANPLQKYLVDLVNRCEDESGSYGEPLGHIWLGDTDREEVDFIVLISIPVFNNLVQSTRYALVDHLLCRMDGEEDEESGAMKWKLRDPDVVEYAQCAERRGAWHQGLQELQDCLEGAPSNQKLEQAIEDMNMRGTGTTVTVGFAGGAKTVIADGNDAAAGDNVDDSGFNFASPEMADEDEEAAE